jgi:hypothetical protein
MAKAIEVKGLKEFRKELKGVSSEMPKALRLWHKDIADSVAARARGTASGMGGVQAKAAGSIKGYATQTQASIGFPSGGIAGAAYWGMKRHTGWYAAARYSGSRRQHPVWIGASWEPAVAGQGPYAINDTLAEMLPEIDDKYLDGIEALARSAFPD